jgi:hypothetical protein
VAGMGRGQGATVPGLWGKGRFGQAACSMLSHDLLVMADTQKLTLQKLDFRVSISTKTLKVQGFRYFSFLQLCRLMSCAYYWIEIALNTPNPNRIPARYFNFILYRL